LVCAPAGFGKTTLLSQWVAERAARDWTWVTLDAGDTDPARFWTYLMSALAEVAPPAGRRSLPALGRRPQGLRTNVLPILIEELHQAAGDLVLILEDYHLADCPPVGESLGFFVEARPSRLQLVVSGRSDPQLPLGRWRANGQLAELRAAQLRFDSEEAAAFFRRAGMGGLSPAELATLTARTEGWPAVLRLAAIILGAQGDKGGFVQAFGGSTREVADYLATDVLQTVRPELRAFLLHTSVLPRLCGPLCDAVTGGEASGAILRGLSRAGLFTSPVGLDGRWYRYHQLFAEALRLELEVSEPRKAVQVHARASAWFEREGDLESASEHAIAARDVGLAARLIGHQLQPLLGAGHLATIERWLARLSWPEALQDPELAAARAVAEGERSRPGEAARWLDVAGLGPRDFITAAGVPRGFGTDLLRSFFVAGGVQSAYQAALRAVAEAPVPVWKGAALAGLAQCSCLLGEHHAAAEAASQAMALLPEDANMLSLASGYLALAECHAGRPQRAERAARRIVNLVESRNLALSGTTAICYAGLGAALTAQGYLAEAGDRLSLAVEVYQAGSPSVWLAHALILLAACRHAAGDNAQAREALESATAILDRIPDPGILPALAASQQGKLLAPARRPASYGQELTEREVVVLKLLAAGLTLREIAAQLNVSHNTVKTQVRMAYRKLGAGARAQALQQAAKLGIL
jgi:LuxR family transcriptional regulator, maltose regulon positive regulatory protein